MPSPTPRTLYKTYLECFCVHNAQQSDPTPPPPGSPPATPCQTCTHLQRWRCQGPRPRHPSSTGLLSPESSHHTIIHCIYVTCCDDPIVDGHSFQADHSLGQGANQGPGVPGLMKYLCGGHYGMVAREVVGSASYYEVHLATSTLSDCDGCCGSTWHSS